MAAANRPEKKKKRPEERNDTTTTMEDDQGQELKELQLAVSWQNRERLAATADASKQAESSTTAGKQRFQVSFILVHVKQPLSQQTNDTIFLQQLGLYFTKCRDFVVLCVFNSHKGT